MSNVKNFPPPPKGNYGVDFIGPFQPKWAVTCDGFKVPYLSAIVREDGGIMLMLDGRYLIEGTKDEVNKWVPYIANALAIGAGYSCFGVNSVKEPNPFKVGMTGIGDIPR
jgi:hypothetical protein